MNLPVQFELVLCDDTMSICVFRLASKRELRLKRVRIWIRRVVA